MSCEFFKDRKCTNLSLPQWQDKTISPSVCKSCPEYSGPPRGLGDVISTVTKAVGIKPCGACQKRREALNDLL